MCLSEVGRVIEVHERKEAIVDMGGKERRVSLAVLVLDGLTPNPGDWLLVHTGFAMEVLDEQDALERATLAHEIREGRQR